ncbi:MAG: hypothetical protein LBQ84_08835 [Flavobacteriaceae bacterium]|jgi:hypothetical protein|nr:hypothetical protein [Flavobacteriaceae bacterium]
MASFLARDIVKLIINKDVKNKITSFYYNLIQECLALYANPDKKQLFLELCSKQLNIFDKEKGHPFLSTINFNNIEKTKDLYKEYLLLKGAKTKEVKNKPVLDNWLYNTFYSVSTNAETKKKETAIKIPTDKRNIPVYYINLVKKEQDIETWLNSVKKGNEKNPNPKPIDLPTNLFDKVLNDLLMQKNINISDKNKKYNFSKLLALWLNDTQPFYKEERHYTVFKDQPYEANIKLNPNEDKKISEYYTKTLTDTFKKRKKNRQENTRNTNSTSL